MTSGTLEDKVSAQTLIVQESPIHTMKTFESLVSLAGKKSRNHALMALGALKDLLGQGVVLPSERKLKAFGKQPGLIAALQDYNTGSESEEKLATRIPSIHLVFWAYEDWLKRTYFELLKVMERWCNDEVEFARTRAITFVWELLKEKPEQEENLLRLLVNKLGDTANKVASRASYLLLQLQTTHPAMKNIVIGAIESDLLFKPGQSLHAKYYATITLNQTVLSSKEPEVANKLIEIYFSLFLSLLKRDKQENEKPTKPLQGGGGKAGRKARQKARLEEYARESEDELKERLIAQILTGVNRAFPFANTDDATFESHMDTIFRITHSANFNTAIQALMLVQQISASKQYAAERYYRTLYESLLDPRLITSSKQILYLNLLYKSLKNDISIKRIKAFVKRLLQIISLHEPPFVCGVLYLISELQKTVPSIQSMIDQPEEDYDDGEEVFRDVGDDQSLEAKTGTADISTSSTNKTYDGRKRDPEYSNAERSCIWEILPLQAHFHPTVALYASRILASQQFAETPDPTLHSLSHFLDRFAYRSPRAKAAKPRGSSIMQPLAGAPTIDLLVHDRGTGKTEQRLNVEEFWMQSKDEVAPDEVFFHQYFEQTNKKKSRAEKRAEKKKKKVAMDLGDDESTNEEEEEEIWKALVKSKPEVEGNLEEDEDNELMDELMEDDEGDENEGHHGEIESHVALDSEDNEELAIGSIDDHSDAEFNVVDLEDGEDAFIDSDEEVPSDIEAALHSQGTTKDSQRHEKSDDRKSKRRKLKSLPTFASIEDYAQLLGDDDEE